MSDLGGSGGRMSWWWLRFNRGPRRGLDGSRGAGVLSSCFGGATALTSGVGCEGATGWGCGADRGVELGVERLGCGGFTLGRLRRGQIPWPRLRGLGGRRFRGPLLVRRDRVVRLRKNARGILAGTRVICRLRCRTSSLWVPWWFRKGRSSQDLGAIRFGGVP